MANRGSKNLPKPLSHVMGPALEFTLSNSRARASEKQWKQCQTLFWGALKSLQMVTAAMKLKDAYSLAG